MTGTIRLRRDQLAKFRRLKNLNTDAELAAAMKVNPATVSRVLSGKTPPGANFITGLLRVFGFDFFNDLFEMPNDDAEDVAA